jgi:cytidine deaminase
MSDTPAGDELTPEEAASLLEAARQVRRNSYSPYSRFPVGAALLAADGRLFTGVNVENASYGLGTCAERSAVARAIAEGTRAFRAVAVVGPRDDEPCLPCGSCRQILYEFAPDLHVVVTGDEAGPRVHRLRALLPEAFGSDALRGAGARAD